MHYMLLLMGEEVDWEAITPEEAQATIDEMGKFNGQLEESGAMVTAGGFRAARRRPSSASTRAAARPSPTAPSSRPRSS